MRLVYVEWVDACGGHGKWMDPGEVEDLAPVLCRSVGWVAVDAPDYITIVAHDADGNCYDGAIAIPLGNVQKMKELTID